MILRLPVLVELEFGNVGFLEEGETGIPGERPLGAKERTNNKLNPHMAQSRTLTQSSSFLVSGQRQRELRTIRMIVNKL